MSLLASTRANPVDEALRYLGLPQEAGSTIAPPPIKQEVPDSLFPSFARIGEDHVTWLLRIDAPLALFSPSAEGVPRTREFRFRLWIDSVSNRLSGIFATPLDLSMDSISHFPSSALIVFPEDGRKFTGFPDLPPRFGLLHALEQCKGFAPRALSISAAFVDLSINGDSVGNFWVIDLQMPVEKQIDSMAWRRPPPLTDWRFYVNGETGRVTTYMGITKAKRLNSQ